MGQEVDVCASYGWFARFISETEYYTRIGEEIKMEGSFEQRLAALKQSQNVENKMEVKKPKGNHFLDKYNQKPGDNEEKSYRKAYIPRSDKHQPMEVTSKRPVGRYRPVVEMKTAERVYDPRFLNHTGTFNEDVYKRSYSFLKDYQKDELQQLKDKLSKTKNTDTRAELSLKISGMESRFRNSTNSDRRQKVIRQWRKEEEELVKQGKKPHFLKESEIKKLVLLDKYEDIKSKSTSSTTFEKMIEKRRKKTASKERRSLPFVRRSAQ